jgi:hypothetical protein
MSVERGLAGVQNFDQVVGNTNVSTVVGRNSPAATPWPTTPTS